MPEKTKVYTSHVTLRRMISILFLLGFFSCTNSEVYDFEQQEEIKFEVCRQSAGAGNTRVAATGTFVTIHEGPWDHPGNWQNGLIPTPGSSGKIIIQHEMRYDGAVSGAFSFAGDIDVNTGGGIVFSTTSEVKVEGNVNLNFNTYIFSDAAVIFRGGSVMVESQAKLSSQGQLTFDGITSAHIYGILETEQDWLLVNSSKVDVDANAYVKVGDDLVLSDDSRLTNQLVADCQSNQFYVGDNILLTSTTDKMIDGSGRIILGGQPANHDNGDSMTEIYSHVYGVFGSGYSNQLYSSLGNPVILKNTDQAYPQRPNCEDGSSLPVVLIRWEAKYQAPNAIIVGWSTSSETRAGFYRVFLVDPCETNVMENTYEVAKVNSKGDNEGNSGGILDYRITIPLKKGARGGTYLVKLMQYGMNGNLEEDFHFKAVRVGR